jgi:hypothetical protein
MATPLSASVQYAAVAGQLVTPRRLLQALEPESGGLTPLPPLPTLFKYKKLDHRVLLIHLDLRQEYPFEIRER